MMTMDTAVWFNPGCSNCLTTQGILEDRGVEADYVRYLEQAPGRDELVRVLSMLGTDDPRIIVREKEPVYHELGLGSAGPDELLDAMAANPVLIQRPIVIHRGRAVVARPPERVLELLDD